MFFLRLHIIVFITALTFIQTHAQSNFFSNKAVSWQQESVNENTEERVLIAIDLLLKSESNIVDLTTVDKLKSLGYLAIAQSGFKGNLTDKYQRSGWWMLSYPVAIKYGLQVTNLIDERRNVEKSTIAAYHYWNDLKTYYASEELADLVFLKSPMALEKYWNDSINYPKEYVAIRNTNTQLVQLKQAYNKHKLINKVGPPEQLVVQVKSDQPLSFTAIQHFIHLPTSQIEALNLEWITNVFEPLLGELHLPVSYQEEFNKHKNNIAQKTQEDQRILAAINTKRVKQLQGEVPDLNTYKPISYKVKMGDNLGQIAQRNHVKIASIRSWNGLKSDRIYAGQRLTVYVPINQKVIIPKEVEKKATTNLNPGEYQEYKVQPGDTLWSISKKYEHVSIENIMVDNGIDEHIAPDQIIKIRNK